MMSPSFTLRKQSAHVNNNKSKDYSPADFFHPNIICDKSCGIWLRRPYPRVDPECMHQLIISYLCENDYTRPNLLRVPPPNIAVLVDVCSYIFSARITSLFRQDMESYCEFYGEETTKKGGVAHTLLVFPSCGAGIIDDRHATLEEWIGVMVNIVCKEYNWKMEMMKMKVAIRAAGVVQKGSAWANMKEGVLRTIGVNGGLGLRGGGGWGVAAWVYSNIKRSKQ
ncbi:hypothetical protein TWF281_007134 [Arthrobotrys megalospora]